MASLCILVMVFIVSLLLTAWALAFAARVVGSSRGKMRFGMAAAAIMVVVGVAVACIDASLPVTHEIAAAAVRLALFVVELVVIFLLLRRVFSLSLRRTFAPFAAFVVLILAQVGLALFVIRPFLVEAFVLPTPSMAPTIEQGDLFVANKLLRPRRWDLMVYRARGSDGQSAVFCKRLVGLPGERLRFDGGEVCVNDQAVAAPPVLAGRCHARPAALPPAQARYRDGDTIVLGSDEYFLIGDHVEGSWDSRMNGPSDRSSLVGVVDLVYWPPGRARVVR